MCVGENGAPQAVRYLNAQLAVLHGNAEECLIAHPDARTEENRQFYALAEFVVPRSGNPSLSPSESGSIFYASFGKPELKFICGHDALLILTLDQGHVMLDNTRAGRGQVVRIPAGSRITYRVSYESRRIVGNDLKIGDYGCSIELLILDLKNATLIGVDPEQTGGRDALARYLAQYLDVLHSAGNHVIFSLPQFDQRGAQITIDHSLMGSFGDYEWRSTIYGVTTDQINTYMSSLWLKSAMLAYGSITGDSSDWRPRCLAEFSRKEEGQYFRIKFGAPQVNILCAKEVVVTFDIDEVEFFESEDFSLPPVRSYTKWKVALVVNVLQGRGEDNLAVTIVFDLSNGRYHSGLSAYPGLGDDEDSLDYQDIIIAFLSLDYLAILHGAGYHTIYSHDARWETIRKLKFDSVEDAEGSWWSLELGDSSGASSRETIQRTSMHGFDQVVAISQGSINAQFSSTTIRGGAHSMFHSWTYEQFFSANFRPLSLQLLSNNRAIVWMHLSNGHLKTLRDWVPWDGSTDYEFRDWRLAFEVDIKMCTKNEFEGFASATYKGMSPFEKHGTLPDRDLKHVYLDLRRAEYLHEYSTYSDIRTDVEDSRSVILKLQAVIYYLSQYYFPALCKEGLNILSSIPVWTSGQSLPSYALTSVTFHVYSKVEVTRHNWAHITPGLEPIIVVLGTTGFRPLPSERLEFSTGWIVHANRGFSHGTLSIARRVFIEQRLLALLSNVNALTTMIPIFVDPLQGFHGLSLKRWADHDQRKDRPSKWELLPSDGEGCLKYLWEHCEEWHYKLRGNGNMMNTTYEVSCITRNYVELPTAVKHGALHIKISGKVDLSLKLQDGDHRSYSANAAVSWSTNVTVQTVGSGIKVNTLGSHDPVFTKADYSESAAHRFRSPTDMLREAFPAQVGLDELVREIRAFEGAWEYYYPLAAPYSLASPVFNDDGDLLFELRRHASAAAAPAGAAARMSRSSTPGLGGRRPQSRAGRSGRSSPAPRSPMRSSSPPPGTAAHAAFGEFIKIVNGPSRGPVTVLSGPAMGVI